MSKRIFRPTGIGFYLFFLCTSWSYAQSGGNLSGIILDAKTNQPVPFATVFFAGSMIGTTASDKGAYQLVNILPGKYDLTISSVGYILTRVPVVIVAGDRKLTIAIQPDVRVLKEIAINSNNAEYARNIRRFKKFFLGPTQNASKCTIRNLEDVVVSYDNDLKILTATCDKPIIVENKATGYRVYYLLKDFEVNDKTHLYTLSGVPRFESLSPQKKSDIHHWNKERDRGYFGSITHFMRSLKFSCLEDDHFRMYLLTPVKDSSPFETERVNDTLYLVTPVRESDVFARKYDEQLFLKIVYDGETQESGYDTDRKVDEFQEGWYRSTKRSPSAGWLQPQTSYLKFRQHGLVIYDNGYYEDELSYYTFGYLGWANGIADLVPLEYQPRLKQADGGSPQTETDSVHVSLTGLSSITGKITDFDTQQPVGGGSVFLATSERVGTISEDGNYHLQNLPKGRFDVIISAPGYETIVAPIVFAGTDATISWILQKKPTDVIAGIRSRAADVRVVKKYFNGITNNSEKCEILNIADVDIVYDPDKKSISATASKPIIVGNKALGYRISCLLNLFSFDYIKTSFSTDAICSIEEMTPESDAQAKHWRRARQVAWRGSFVEFLSSLRDKKLKANHYEISRKDGENWIATDETWFFSDRPYGPVELKVSYTRESPEITFSGRQVQGPQESYVTLTKDDLRSWPNVYLKRPERYNMKGYFLYSSGIAEMLPIEFTPTE